MKIFVVSYEYGLKATGICVERLVRGLARAGCEVEVLCGKCREGFSEDRLCVQRCAQWPSRPARLFEILSDVAGHDLAHFFWRKRVARLAKKVAWSKGDVIYAVASPAASLIAGLEASRDTGLPLVAHFMDPIPAPVEWVPNAAYRRRMINTARRVLECASLVAFGNEAMARYQQETAGVSVAKRSVVVPNIIPEWRDLGPPKGSVPIFVYLGTFYRNRKANELLEGFERFLDKSPRARLRIIGSSENAVRPHLRARRVAEAVELLPRTDTPCEAMKQATVLVDVDACDREPIFISTKLMEYLSVNRVIVSITPPNSPTANLLAQVSETAVVTPHDPARIADAMLTAARMADRPAAFTKRQQVFREFTAEAISCKLKACFRRIAGDCG